LKTKDRLIVALDVATADEARALVERLGNSVGMYKVGSQLFTTAGPALVRELVSAGHPVFLDLKFHDIPSTVAHAVSAAAALGVALVDVHASGGRAMLEAAAAARKGTATRLLAITVLTSHSQGTLAEVGVPEPLEQSVRRLARLARDAGADGVVASPHEVPLIREAYGREFLAVTPGIRPSGSPASDQARAATPALALRSGADYVVVGRPITEAADPRAAAAAIIAELESAALPSPA
jgi:orotidine-5'-phosphate decarboxylase